MTKRVAIADMVYLTNDREGIVRFKGKTGFGLGEWYGVELRTDHKTRHDGLIHGKRYFRCPRNKGLFIRRQIIVDVMDKRTAEQKTRVFRMGGTARKVNKKIHRKYKTKTEITKKKTKKKVAKTERKPKKDIIKEEKEKQSKTKVEQKQKKPKQKQKQKDNEASTSAAQGEEPKDFSSKESVSNPKSRKYFGKDQVFTGLDRRRSRYEDIMLMDPVALMVHDTKSTTTELGTKRRNKSKNKTKRNNTNKNKLSAPSGAMEDDIDRDRDRDKESEKRRSKRSKKAENIESPVSPPSMSVSPTVSPSVSPSLSPAVSPGPAASPSSKYRPFGGDAAPNKLIAPLHIKQISMEFRKGNLKAKLKKVSTTKRKKRLGTIRNVYDKYSAKADYPILDDLRNETLVSDFLSFELYSLYRNESNIVNDYTIDRAIGCGCFYLPDPIGFRLADFKTYEVFQDLCDELLCILHDEWNPKDRPHKKDTDWRSLVMNKAQAHDRSRISYGHNIMRSRSPNMVKFKTRRNRGNSTVDAKTSGGLGMLQMVQNMKEKRRKSKRRQIGEIGEIAEDTETNLTNTCGSVDLTNLPSKSPNMMHSSSAYAPEKEKKDKSRKSNKMHHKRIRGKEKASHVRSSLQNSSFMMARMTLWDSDYVSGCRITLSRNLHGFRFSNVISRCERRNLEKMLSQCLSQCNEGPLKGRYRPYSKINKQKIPLLIETDKLFPKPDAPGLVMAGYARDWPESRGIFINTNKNLYIWCNYLEHLHLISVQNDGNVLMAFKRLFDSEQKLESLMKQRQEIFLGNLRIRQQEIRQRESPYVSSPIVVIPMVTEQMLLTETPTEQKETLPSYPCTPTPSTPTKKEEKEKEKEKEEEKKKHRGVRLTKQEYRIKKLNVEALDTGFVYDDELGYISSNPQYFGTSMRVYVTVKLPNLIKHEKFNDILEIRNLTAYQHDVDSAQQMFMAYASQLPSKTQLTQIKQRRSSMHLNKVSKIASSETTHHDDEQISAAAPVTDDEKTKEKTNRRSSNPALVTNYNRSKQKKHKSIAIIREGNTKKKHGKKKEKQQTMNAAVDANPDHEIDFMSNLNLPDIDGGKVTNEYNEPKVSLKTLTQSMQKYKSAPIEDDDDEKQTLSLQQEETQRKQEDITAQQQESPSATTDTDTDNVLIHDDEDLGDVVDPTQYKEEITIYQTVSLGISEVEQVRSMIEAINYLIEFEKLLSAGKSLGERLNAERLKKANLRHQLIN